VGGRCFVRDAIRPRVIAGRLLAIVTDSGGYRGSGQVTAVWEVVCRNTLGVSADRVLRNWLDAWSGEKAFHHGFARNVGAAICVAGAAHAAAPNIRIQGESARLLKLGRATLALTSMRAGLAAGGARKATLVPVGANADWY
jgi:hypothetical protein